MKVTRVGEGPIVTEVKNHWKIIALGIQNKDLTGLQCARIGISYFEPGGGGKDTGASFERVYYMLSGSMTVKCGDEEITIKQGDSNFHSIS